MDFLPILYALGVLLFLGLIFGVALSIAAKKFAVKQDERVGRIKDTLGGANCGACGFAGCDAFAEAVVKGSASVDGCIAGGNKCARKIAEIMGVTAGDNKVIKVARARCQGTCDHVSLRYHYNGVQTCRAAASISGGPKLCEFACLGYGDCMSRCKFGAISIRDGVAEIDDTKCTGCGVCAETCPHDIISLIPRDRTVVVLCRNKATGKIARSQCKTACIGCKRCEKACPSDAIRVVDGVAEINPDTCTRCGACVDTCPSHCIVNLYVKIDERVGEQREEEQ